ncbi:ABC transporter ATP-binding protein [Chitinimonas arctica]|uniref:ABC transporter ATP-binding protein n=1 Tax=Chitinimonas arctica TaxID=2594795 RepID=A0A516SGK8_9NEIS|nr:ABC transporter ATP-binding protein [Chitinimonas arctica]QDQ27296.1 ABC transporter ATP-binding protein [Chitinimonas arctica]
MFNFFEKRLNPFPDTTPTIPPPGLLAFLWACTAGSRPYILAMALCTAIVGAFDAALLGMLGDLVDSLGRLDPAHLWRDFPASLLWMASMILFSPLLLLLCVLNRNQILGSNLPMRLRWLFHRLMLDQSMAFYQNEFAGRVSAKVLQTAQAVREVIMILFDVLVFVLINFVTMAVFATRLDVWLLLPFAAWLTLYGVALSYFVPRLTRQARSLADARSLLTGRITDAYANITTVKLFSHADRESGFAKHAMQDFLAGDCQRHRLTSRLDVTLHCLNMLLILCSAGLSLGLWSHGHLGIGAVAAATAMAVRLNGMSHWFMWEMATLFEQFGTIQDGINTLCSPRAVLDVPSAKPLRLAQGGDIRLDKVCFSYGGERKVFQDLSLHIRPGEKVGLVGRSGAGKSSIINLLLRFHDLESGEVRMDGQDIAEVSQNSLRRQIGLVTQDTSLLHRSVRDNLLYGRPDATDADMIAAARRAEAHDFILGLRDTAGRVGYDAHVGERGVKLSGGQRQRIAIARVMLKDAPILLLDEATSALDSEVEAAIQSNLHQLMQNKTVVAIAHRLSTIAAMDRLIVLDQGRIVEEGDHQALLARGGLYARLWAHQSGGFLCEDALDDAPEAALG